MFPAAAGGDGSEYKDALERVQSRRGRGVTYLQLLGQPRVQLGAAFMPLAPNKRFQLLCYLAYHGEWISRDKLAFLFWPDETNHTARHNLRQLLKYVRKNVWLKGLETDEYGLRWQVDTDVAALRQALEQGRAEEALALYQGPLLPGMEGDEAGEFSGWLEREREHFHGQWRESLLARAQELEEAGQHDKAATLFHSLLTQDELDEEALQAYMGAATRAGRWQQALRTYQAFAKRLSHELDMEPTSTTQLLAQALEEAIKSAKSRAPNPVPRPAPPPPAAPSTVAVKIASPSLPTPATSFIGRDLELAEVVHLLSKRDCRLLSLTGAGGVGKTRMALQAASELVQNYPDGVFFVPLEALTSAALIPASIASALGLELQGQEESVAQLIGYLKTRRMLLVLDNYEHLLEGATLASELLQSCPKLKLLVTSRERLDLEEEQLLPVGGLSYPGFEATLDQASAYDAVQLFLERAQRVRPTFALDGENLPHILKICRLIDGSPLGLELAAVWVRAVTVAEIAQELEKSLDFLSTSSRNIKERHRSIRAAFEYSWKLLTPAEQEVLRKLSVFRGGFVKEAAAVVTGASVAVLAALVDKSLLRMSPSGRYDRHPLLYHYTQEKLFEHPEAEHETREKHAGYFLALAEEAESQLIIGAQQGLWLERLELEHDNLRAGLDSAEVADAKTALRLAGALAQFWWQHGHLSEGRERLARVLAQASEQTAARAKALSGAGTLAFYQSDFSSARSLHEESLATRRVLRDRQGIADSLTNLGCVANMQGDNTTARSLHEESLAIFKDLGDKLGMGKALGNLGVVAEEQGDYALAHSLYEQGLTINKELKDEHLAAISLSNLGEVALKQGDDASARPYFEECLAMSRNMGARYLVAWSLNLLGLCASRQEDYALARAHFEESLAIRRELGDKGGIVDSLHNLGAIAREQGDYALARSLLKESLVISKESEHRPNIACSLESMASLAAVTGRPDQAARLWGAAAALREAVGAPLPAHHRSRCERTMTAIRSQLGEVAFSAAWIEGRKLGLEQAVAYALEH